MYTYPEKYDLIVVGAGHAGCEASLAGARMGCRVLLLTPNLDTIAQMSCNPAIGGIGKGHLVREIDALGGEMGLNTDKTALQIRMLNTKKGPAVWASRAQSDKKAYGARMKGVLEGQERLDIKQEMVSGLIRKDGNAAGVLCETGTVYCAKAVVITTGTFLNGLIHIGEVSFPGGRAGERASVGLGEELRNLGLIVGRLKTGTPPRLNARNIEFQKMTELQGDEDPAQFSFRTGRLVLNQLPCHITHTNERTHQIIRNNLHRSPLYAGRIKSTGVRYCPSIEDKIVKFPNRGGHQIFVEPEGRDTREVYLNGVSTSLPYEVQLEIVRSVEGLERAEILRPGYAIEYDFVPPTQLNPTLETKLVKNLYLAGQINGTSGYEEAAAQGIMAGINAALRVSGKAGFVLGRDEAYIGVLIDDLVTRGTEEPYRMFTSRAEYRLLLRQDNADSRLMGYGREFGLIPEEVYARMRMREALVRDAHERLQNIRTEGRSLVELLRRPGVGFKELKGYIQGDFPELDPELILKLETEAKYAGYMKRQRDQIFRSAGLEGQRIPEGFDYAGVRGIKNEAMEKLIRIQPLSVGQAARISGITPADISILTLWMEREHRSRKAIVPRGTFAD